MIYLLGCKSEVAFTENVGCFRGWGFLWGNCLCTQHLEELGLLQ
jgi:hypothetical protein